MVSAGLGVASVAALRAKGFAIPELFGSGFLSLFSWLTAFLVICAWYLVGCLPGWVCGCGC